MRKNVLWKRPRILLFVVIAAVIFMTFQFFSLEALFHTQTRAVQRTYLHVRDQGQENTIDDDILLDVDAKNKPDGEQRLPNTPLGVHADDAHLYEGVHIGQDNMFRCIKSKV